MTLLYHLLLPFFWCIPISLVAAELTTAMRCREVSIVGLGAAFGDFWDFSRAGGIGGRRSSSAELMPCCSPIILPSSFPKSRAGSTM